MTIQRRLLIVAALCVIASTMPSLAASEHGVQPKVVTLDNGLQLLLVERHEQPSVSACLIFDVGSCNDPAGVSGIAHMFEHMMFKGTEAIGTTDYVKEVELIKKQDDLRERMNAEMNRMRLMKRRGEIDDVLDPAQWTPDYSAMKVEYDKLLEDERKLVINNDLANIYSDNGGASLNAGTSNDMTIYYVTLPANKLELFFWMESDRLANAIMREFYVERENVREERRLRTDSTPTGKFREAFEALFWQVHPYGRPVLGWASEVESITRDDVRNFFKVYYAPNNATLVLVGDFDSDEAVAMAKRYFERIPRGEQEPPMLVTEEPTPIAERRFYAEAETNPQVEIRFHGVAIGHKDEAALDVASSLLSGKSGRLYKRLVTEDDAVIGVPGAFNTSRKYAGYFSLSATIKEGHTPEEVETILLEELQNLADGEITDHELQKVKNQTLASSIRGLKSNRGLMFQLAVYETWYDWRYINESTDRVLAVTPEDVKRVIKKYMEPEFRTVAIYRTKEGAKTGGDSELDALLADLPAAHQQQIKAGIEKLRTMEDIDMLNQQVASLEQASASGQIPEQQKPVFDYMVKVMKERIAELEAANSKESE